MRMNNKKKFTPGFKPLHIEAQTFRDLQRLQSFREGGRQTLHFDLKDIASELISYALEKADVVADVGKRAADNFIRKLESGGAQSEKPLLVSDEIFQRLQELKRAQSCGHHALHLDLHDTATALVQLALAIDGVREIVHMRATTKFVNDMKIKRGLA